MVMAAENHSTEEVGLVRGEGEGGSIEERSFAALGMTDKEKRQIKTRQTEKPANPRTDLKIGHYKSEERAWLPVDAVAGVVKFVVWVG
jgi:hypothetical protein